MAVTSQSSILIKNGRVLQFDSTRRATFPKLDVLIVNQTLAKVQEEITWDGRSRVIDATDCIVSPGMIDGHRHLYQSHMRGIVGNATHVEYCGLFLMGKYIYSTPEDVYLAQLGAAVEAIYSGVTTVLDHSHGQLSLEHAKECIRASVESGIRSIYCFTPKALPVKLNPLTLPVVDRLHKTQLDQFYHFAEENPLGGTSNDGRVTLGLGYDGIQHRPLDQTVELFKLVYRKGMQVTFHDVPTHGIGVMKFLQKHQLLSDAIVLSHCNGRSDEDLQEARRRGVGIVATPESEMQMTHGWPEGFRALRAGCRTGLGVDTSLACSGDLFAAMRLSLQTQRARDNAASIEQTGREAATLEAQADQALWMATTGGAEAIHQESQIGAIEEGKKADIIVVKTTSPCMVGSSDLAAALVLHASPADVDTVIINGELVKAEGELVKIDWGHLVTRLKESREQIERRARGVDWDQNVREVAELIHSAMQDE